jgi:hypothetical protein
MAYVSIDQPELYREVLHPPDMPSLAVPRLGQFMLTF